MSRSWLDAPLGWLGRALCSLPPPVQNLLGGGPLERDGRRLETELLVLRRIAALIEERGGFSADGLRVRQNRMARAVGGRRDESVPTRELSIDGAAGRRPARLYRAAGRAPLLVFFHGGGFMFGDLESHDAPCRLLCRHGGFHVLSASYRLAPEHPFPAALEDARSALRWAHAHAAELGADPARVAVGGDSAGANLAAVVAQEARGDGGPAPSAQILVYPPVDRTPAWPSVERLGTGFYLTRDAITTYHDAYVTPARRAETRDDPRVHPLRARDLAGLPPALVVTAGFDPLRDEGEAYADALAAAGTPVVRRRYDRLIHGFFNMVGISGACRAAVIDVALAARTVVGGVS